MKRDAYNFEGNWEAWKQNHYDGMKGIRKEDHKLLIEFLKDMELGLNTPVGRKGKRGPGTLLNLAQHNLLFLENFDKPLVKLTKQDLHSLEDKIVKGKIERKRGGNFTQFGNYIKDFKVFWHWLQRVGKVKEDITVDISAKTTKPSWVFLSEEHIKKFFNKLSFDMRVICWFMYDSGARVTETNSLKIENFSKDFTEVNIPEEVSKTFGRTIKLKLSSQLLKDYVKEFDLKPSDYLVRKDLWAMNKYLKYNCGKLFGKETVSHPKVKGLCGSFTLYDIRHNSACFWLNRYPTQNGLMYRFGWRGADKIEYYSEFLGVRDKIDDQNMVTSEEKTKFEKEIEQLKSHTSESDERYDLLVEELKRLRNTVAQMTKTRK